MCVWGGMWCWLGRCLAKFRLCGMLLYIGVFTGDSLALANELNGTHATMVTVFVKAKAKCHDDEGIQATPPLVSLP